MAIITDTTRREDLIYSIAASCPMEENGVDLKIIPDLCSAELTRLCGSSAPDSWEDWNSYCCAFLLDDYYPGREEVPLKEERRDAVTFYLDVLNALFDRERKELGPDRARDLVLLGEEEYKGFDTSAEY